MPESILVVVEQREGKLNRVSWETLAAGQAIATETGWALEAAVVRAQVMRRRGVGPAVRDALSAAYRTLGPAARQ